MINRLWKTPVSPVNKNTKLYFFFFFSSAGVGGLCVGIFSSLQGWLCVGVLCALQCAKNSVGSGRQSHGCLNVCRMSFRVTYNGSHICEGGDF